MRFVDDLENQVKEYLSGDYEIIEVEDIPSVDNVTFKKKAMKMKLCAFSIDIRKSSDLLIKHHKQTSGKVHKAFLTIASKVVNFYGGEIRSFQGDSILVFWAANYQSDLAKAIKAAMVIKWMLSFKLSKYFEKYEKIDFGIGIDWSDVYILRAGISRNANNNDLVFIGKCVNFATAIANQTKSPHNIGISSDMYVNLEEDVKYHYKPANDYESFVNRGNIYEIEGKNYKRIDMWEVGRVSWNDKFYDCKLTRFFWTID